MLSRSAIFVISFWRALGSVRTRGGSLLLALHLSDECDDVPNLVVTKVPARYAREPHSVANDVEQLPVCEFLDVIGVEVRDLGRKTPGRFRVALPIYSVAHRAVVRVNPSRLLRLGGVRREWVF